MPPRKPGEKKPEDYWGLVCWKVHCCFYMYSLKGTVAFWSIYIVANITDRVFQVPLFKRYHYVINTVMYSLKLQFCSEVFNYLKTQKNIEKKENNPLTLT